MVFISINLYTVKPVVHDTRVDCFPVLSETDFFAIFNSDTKFLLQSMSD